MNYEYQTMNEEPVVAEVTDYGYEECEPVPSSKASVASIDALQYEPYPPPYDQMDPAKSQPLPPDRLARKQRHFCRRGGAGHSDLLRSAVMAAMEAQDSSSGDEGQGIGAGRQRRESLVSLQDSLATTQLSPRKRARIFSKKNGGPGLEQGPPEADADVAQASQLFVSMCKVDKEAEPSDSPRRDPVRKAPPRRVSRRTSYDSRISDVSDDLDFDFLSDSE